MTFVWELVQQLSIQILRIKNEVYGLVKDYLVEQEVLIKLVLVEDLNDETSKEVVIERNFLSRKRNIRKINGIPVLDKEFEDKLQELHFSESYSRETNS